MMTKKQIMEKAIECADISGLNGIDRFNYLAKVQESGVYKNAPDSDDKAFAKECQKETENLREELTNTVNEIVNGKGFFR